MQNNSETIAAIATATGRGGIGVIRISGNSLADFAKEISGKKPEARKAIHTDFLDEKAEAIDNGILLYFPAPHSFTGEDVIELQAHGGAIILQMLLSRCLALGARVANAGEFTQRAFLNGKLDLVEAEAVADLIDASSMRAAQSALRSLQGHFSSEINALKDELIKTRLFIEATLDFPEEDIEFTDAPRLKTQTLALASRVKNIQTRATQGKLLQNGMQIVLIGEPNVGKSSLLNQLAEDELAIVTPIAGTTRDAVRASLSIEGIPLHIVDTAGLRETSDLVEKIGIEKTWAEINKADLILLLLEAKIGLTEKNQSIINQLPAHLPCLYVFNKIDLLDTKIEEKIETHAETTRIFLSAKTGKGISLLREELLKIAGFSPTENVFLARSRHLEALNEAAEHLQNAMEVLPALEFFAEELRLAQNALSKITGEFSADDLLGEIFSHFCIGK